MKRKIFSLFFIWAIGVCGLYGKTLFQLIEKNGTKVSYSTENISTITFSEFGMTVNQNNGGLRIHTFENMVKAYFELNVAIVEKTDRISNFTAYPNPVSQVLNLKLSSGNNTLVEVELRSIDGRLVLSKNADFQNGTAQIDVSALEKGIYFCNYKDGKKTNAIKIIKK